jgi:hypothetical protein
MLKLISVRVFNKIKIAFIFLLIFWVRDTQGQIISRVKVNGDSTNIHFCHNTSYSVSFDTANFATLNPVFRVELSDATGSFVTPIAISASSNLLLHSITVPVDSPLSNNYKIRVRVISPVGIAASDSIINITLTKPTAAFTINNNNACAGSSVSFTNNSSGVSTLTHSWNFSTTAGAPSSPNTSFAPTVQFNPAVGGGTVNYSVLLTVTDGYGCTNNTSNNVSVKQKPDASIISDPLTSGNFVNSPNSSNPTIFRKCNLTPPHNLTLEDVSISNTSNTFFNINWGDGSTAYNNFNFHKFNWLSKHKNIYCLCRNEPINRFT